MLKQSNWFLACFLLFFSCAVQATTACLTDLDCDNDWAKDNCACGVHAICKGRTLLNLEGHCQCFGAHGRCHRSPSNTSVRIRGANPIRRGLPVH
jgi:hypothetical protein